MHIVLITRADPPLRIARLRGCGMLTEFRANDLRFSFDETMTFLNKRMDLRLSDENVSALEKRTEGWIIGLQLAALSMQHHNDKGEFIAAFSGGHPFVLEYLTEEVVDQLPGFLQNFLLQTAILEQFNASLCGWVTSHTDSATQIAHLQHQNLFLVPLDDERVWFRYHHLFRDLLKNRLQKEFSTEQINQLYYRASQWYWNENELEEAVRYALLTGIITHTNDPDRVIHQAQEALTYLLEDALISRARVHNAMGTAYAYGDQVDLGNQNFEQARDLAFQAKNPFLATAAIEMLAGMQIYHQGHLHMANRHLQQILIWE